MKKLMPIFWVIIILGFSTKSFGQLELEGPTGVFANPLAYVVPSGKEKISKPEISSHFVDLEDDNLSTFSITMGFMNRFEMGYTSGDFGVLDLNLFHGKALIIEEGFKEKKWIPALSLGIIHRDVESGDADTDFYLVGTKLISELPKPLLLSAAWRSTKALANGLFGFRNHRKDQFEGVIALLLTEKIIVGVEYKEQPDADDWVTCCVRFNAQPNLQFDFGIGDLGKGIHNQFAFGISYGF